MKSCGETQRYDHKIPQKLSTCRQTDRFLAVFYNSSLVRNFERPLEDHCGNNSHISECRLDTFLDTFLIRKAPKTGVMTNIEGFVPKEPSKVFGNGSEEFLFVLGTHANPLALRRQLKYAHNHQIHPVRILDVEHPTSGVGSSRSAWIVATCCPHSPT